MMKRTVWMLVAVMVLVGLQACGGSSTPAPADTTTYEGTIVGIKGGTAESGVLTVTIQEGGVAKAFPFSFIQSAWAQASDIDATGLIVFTGGTRVDLTGTYNPTTRTVNLTGSGYTLTGTIANGELNGTYTSDDGASGGFTTLDAEDTTVNVLCGTWNNASDSGTWNVVIADNGNFTGMAFVPGEGEVILLSGTIAGTTITVSGSDGGTGTGTLTGTECQGTYTPADGPAYMADWEGSEAQCQ